MRAAQLLQQRQKRAGRAAIFGTTAYVPVGEKELLTVQNVSEVQAAPDGKNMVLVTPGGEIYAADADRQKEVCLGSGSLNSHFTEGDTFQLMALDNAGCTYYSQEAVWRYNFGSDGAIELAKGRPVTTVNQYDSTIMLISPDQTKTVCYYKAEDGYLYWLCDTPAESVLDTTNFYTINVREIPWKDQPYFFCSTYVRKYVLGLKDGQSYEVCQLSNQESTWTYMGSLDDDTVVFFETPYVRGPGTDVFTLNLKTGELKHMFHTEYNKSGSRRGDLLYVVSRRTGSLSGEKCFPTGDLLGGAAPNPRRLPASIIQGEERIYLSSSRTRCVLWRSFRSWRMSLI